MLELDADEVLLLVVLLLELLPLVLELLLDDDADALLDDDCVLAGVFAGASGPTRTTLSRFL